MRMRGMHECGRHECGRHECGRHECGRHECGRHECGRHECGRHECGRHGYMCLYYALKGGREVCTDHAHMMWSMVAARSPESIAARDTQPHIRECTCSTYVNCKGKVCTQSSRLMVRNVLDVGTRGDMYTTQGIALQWMHARRQDILSGAHTGVHGGGQVMQCRNRTDTLVHASNHGPMKPRC